MKRLILFLAVVLGITLQSLSQPISAMPFNGNTNGAFFPIIIPIGSGIFSNRKYPMDSLVFKNGLKTIDGNSLIGSGNIVTSGGGSTIYSSPGYSDNSGSINDEFLVNALGYIKTSNTFSHGTTINWSFSPSTADHSGSFVTSINGDGSGGLTINYPRVKKVLYANLSNDETTVNYSLQIGGSVGLTSSLFSVKKQVAISAKLQGSSNAWTKSGATSPSVLLTSFNTSTGSTEVSSNDLSLDATTIMAHYAGLNNYRVVNKYSGLGTYSFGFYLVNISTGATVTTIDANDVVIINNVGYTAQLVNCNVYSTGVNEFLTSSGQANFWFTASFEAYMIVNAAVGSNIVKWQNYPSATSYKIYRATDAGFTSPALVYSGSANSYTDTSVVSGTKYYYKMVAVVGTDVEVATFAKTAK